MIKIKGELDKLLDQDETKISNELKYKHPEQDQFKKDNPDKKFRPFDPTRKK